MDGLLFTLTLLAALGSGLVAGVFFAFSTFVMSALARLPAPQGIAAMQSINVVVLNPWFLGLFFGTAAIGLLLTILSLLAGSGRSATWAIAGALLYLLGSILVTMRGNVPLNQALAAAQPEGAEGAALWTRYVARWTAWNHVRTAASLAAAAAFILALV